MIIDFDRDSVCMADDAFVPHNEARVLVDTMLASDLLKDSVTYVPKMRNVVWAILSPNNSKKVIGYVITDNQGNAKVESNVGDATLKDLFNKDLQYVSIICKYYHQSSFSWQDGGKEKYRDCKNLLEKVKSYYVVSDGVLTPQEI
jgi:hypothetical protein